MKTYEGEYFDPVSGVMKNKVGIQDRETLRAFEYSCQSHRESQLIENPIKGNFDLEHLKNIHAHMFGDVYEWAGQPRTVKLVKRIDSTNQVNFAKPEDFGALDEKLKQTLKDCDYLKGCATKSDAALELTKTHLILNTMHPFPEGNGRATRQFLSQLAKEAGYQLDYEKVSRADWNHASMQSMPRHRILSGQETFKGDIKPLLSVFNKITHDRSIEKEPEIIGPER